MANRPTGMPTIINMIENRSTWLTVISKYNADSDGIGANVSHAIALPMEHSENVASTNQLYPLFSSMIINYGKYKVLHLCFYDYYLFHITTTCIAVRINGCTNNDTYVFL